MRPATIQNRCLLVEVLNQIFWAMNSNGSWRRSCSTTVVDTMHHEMAGQRSS